MQGPGLLVLVLYLCNCMYHVLYVKPFICCFSDVSAPHFGVYSMLRTWKCSTIDRRPPFSLFLLQTIFLEQALASRGVEWPAQQNCPFGRNISKHPPTSAPLQKMSRQLDTCSCLKYFFLEQVLLTRRRLNGRWARGREQQPVWPEPHALANIANIRTMESRKRLTHHLVSDLEISFRAVHNSF